MSTAGETVKFDFRINARIEVIPLRAPGTVIGLQLFGGGPEYRVRYFYDGYVRYENFRADELRIVEV